jgi:hypothetical protein
MGSLLGEET